MRCSSVSNFACRVSTVAASLVMRTARSAVVGSVIGDEMDGVGEGGAAAAGRWNGDAVDEDRLECDNRLSRALAPRVAGPRL